MMDMDEARPVMARASIYGLSALAFTYPEDQTVDDIRDGVSTLAEALGLAGSRPETVETGLAFGEAVQATPPSVIRRNYNEFFVGRKQCRLDESEYDESIFNRQQRLADAAGFYRAFGFELAGDAYQRADFVGTELEFMHVVLIKHAYALEQGWDDQAEACKDAEGKFLSEHLEWWIPAMCEKLRGASTCAFYRSLSHFLESFIRSEASEYPQPA
ncbi:MAG: hypothetical protein CL878_09180 [Dehalococcoidia bacterium]|nr:hypothetical protein [Dehalococcoidia bacterium]